MIDAAHVAIFLAIGAALGLLGGLFGIGGGVIAIPTLTLFFGMNHVLAQGTALVLVVPTVLTGLWGYGRMPGFDRSAAVQMAVAAIPIAFAGSLFAVHANATLLATGFAAFLGALGLYSAIRAARGNLAPVARPFPRSTIWIVGLLGGVLNGLFAVGGAVFSVPLTTLLYGYTQVQAQGLALALVAPTLIVGLATYAYYGRVAWPVGAALACGSVLAVRPGIALAHRLPERLLRVLFAVLLIATALALAAKR